MSQVPFQVVFRLGFVRERELAETIDMVAALLRGIGNKDVEVF
jgi:hypothetical protein